MFRSALIFVVLISVLLAGCSPSSQPESELSVIAAEGFLADIAQNVAGDRVEVGVLLPQGTDAHTYQPTPQDIARITDSDLFIINGFGMETWLETSISTSDQSLNILEASHGLTPRTLQNGHSHDEDGADGHDHEIDPHYWLDPINVVTYVDNIANALIAIDPEGKPVYEANAKNYKAELMELDKWIRSQVAEIPIEKRKLITNHESLGYFADRYGFEIVATILQGSSTDSAISSTHMIELIKMIEQDKINTIFLSTEENDTLAQQLADETGVNINYDLISHSLSDEGETSTYIGMMRHNVQVLSVLK